MKQAGLGKLIALMAKIGLIGFGGGNALVPVIEQAAVREAKIVDKDEFDKEVVVANITPGALPVEVASGIGRKLCGTKGMLAAAVAMGLPGALLTLVLSMMLASASSFLTEQVRFASVGIAMLIVYILCEYSVHNITSKPARSHERMIALLIVLVVFLVTCGSKITKLLGLPSGSIPSISTLDLLAIVFFAIFFTQGRFVRSAVTPTRAIIAGVIALAYLLSRNEAFGNTSAVLSLGLQALMVVLAVYGFADSLISQPRKRGGFPAKQLFKEAAVLVAFIIICCLPAIVLCPDAFSFSVNALLSVLMSFGGGDAYLVFGEGMFVDTGLITSDDYFSQVVTVSNAMPGSIICKVLTGVGFTVGASSGTAVGLLTALAGFGIGVGVSTLTFLVVYYIYEAFESMQMFMAIKRYIRSVISGLLFTIAVTMLTLCSSVATSYALPSGGVAITCLAVLAVIIWLGRVRVARTSILIAASVALSLVACNAMALL